MAEMPGYRCPGVPGGSDIATKSLANQCFYGKPVLWAAKALSTFMGLCLAVSHRKKSSSCSPTCALLNNES